MRHGGRNWTVRRGKVHELFRAGQSSIEHPWMPGGLLLLLWVALMRLLLGVVRVVMLLGMKHMLPPSSLDRHIRALVITARADDTVVRVRVQRRLDIHHVIIRMDVPFAGVRHAPLGSPDRASLDSGGTEGALISLDTGERVLPHRSRGGGREGMVLLEVVVMVVLLGHVRVHLHRAIGEGRRGVAWRGRDARHTSIINSTSLWVGTI